jgi:probable selenium-dependent hydroxylase accessory protein YqeC
MDEALLDLLAARTGLVCAVGAGGKKTTLYCLAAVHPGRVGLTATVMIPSFPQTLGAHVVIEAPCAIIPAVTQAAAASRIVAFAHPSEKRARFGGISLTELMALREQAGFDVILVKADGARSRWVKAPAEDEPQIPAAATTVIVVVSARVLNEPLSEKTAHRVAHIQAITGVRASEILTPSHLARLLVDPRGGLKGVADAQVVPLINMVDNPELEILAREAGERALAMTHRFDRVVLASMTRPKPLVSVLTR